LDIFHFEKELGRRIHQYDSNFIMSRLSEPKDNNTYQPMTTGDVHVGCMYLEKDGIVGYHQAVIPQLFLVVQGEGWVRGKDTEKLPIKAGQAAFWQSDEWHETGTDTGMVAIVIESPHIDPKAFQNPSQNVRSLNI
jgi:quercetin dioxygenase-like cupin family protein